MYFNRSILSNEAYAHFSYRIIECISICNLICISAKQYNDNTTNQDQVDVKSQNNSRKKLVICFILKYVL